MNFHSTATLVALLLVSGILRGQIKDQYQDKKDGLTTVVVKEDTANDLDVLNSQFDLDEVGMHQVIRITTRQEKATPSSVEVAPSTVSIPEVAPTPRSIPEAVATPEPTVDEDPIMASVEKTGMAETELKLEVAPVAKVAVENQVIQNLTPDEDPDETVITLTTSISETTSPQSISGSSSSTSSFSSSTRKRQRSFNVFNNRFKKQKRKRIPNRRKRHKKCYRF